MSRPKPSPRILMLLENAGIPEDHRVVREARTLMEMGCRVTIICPTVGRQEWAEHVEGIQVYRFPHSFSPDGLLGYVWEYGYSLTMFFFISMFVFIRHGFEVVHVHTPPDLTAIVAVFYRLLGKKFVFDHHDLSPELYLARRGDERPNLLYRILVFFEQFACRNADRLIATNTTQQQVQLERSGVDAKKCFVVRNGPDDAFLRNAEPLQEILQPEKLLLGYVGIIGVQDGVDYMVRVVHELSCNRKRDDFSAVIVGHGPALDSLRELARELSVEKLIRFTGRVPFELVPGHIAAFDICLTPDPSNAYNDSCTTIKTMEYMALGKPTVCFRTKENEVTAADSALYADDNEISEFANQVATLMDDRELRLEMGKRARRRIEEGLKWDRQAVHLVRLYESLIEFSDRSSTQETATDAV